MLAQRREGCLGLLREAVRAVVSRERSSARSESFETDALGAAARGEDLEARSLGFGAGSSGRSFGFNTGSTGPRGAGSLTTTGVAGSTASGSRFTQAA
jgi:hypothetical protein